MLGLGSWLVLSFKPSSPIVRELVLSLTRLSFPLVRFRHNPDQAARTYERFVYSMVKITRFDDYQTWPTHSRGAQRFVGSFFLGC